MRSLGRWHNWLDERAGGAVGRVEQDADTVPLALLRNVLLLDKRLQMLILWLFVITISFYFIYA